VELGHYESEECFIDDLYNLLTDKFQSLEVVKYKKEFPHMFDANSEK
jgi:hypothetical protein